MAEERVNYRRYQDGDAEHPEWPELRVSGGESDSCPTYVHRTAPCQGSCPSGHDIRGWLSIARGIDKPLDDAPWQQYAFERMTKANPFPSVMGRVCPAPCQDGCNRNDVEEFVGINSIEQYVGDWALQNGLAFEKPKTESGKKVAIVGGGPGGLAAAYFLRKKGHACTIFDSYSALGGMMVFGIPGYRTPRDVLEGEIQRIVDMGVETRLDTRVGVDVSIDELEKDFDAVFWAIGAQSGKPLPVPGAEAPNCVDGIVFLRAFNEGRLQHLTGRVLVVGAGDTAMDVAAVARRIGNVDAADGEKLPEKVIMGQTVHDVAQAAKRQGADVWIVYRRPISKAPATEHELQSVIAEGVEIHENLAPKEVILDAEGRATALRVMPADWSSGEMVADEDAAFNIECELIVGATGQAGDFTGFESLDNGWGLMNADSHYRIPDHEGHFVGGDIIKPHLLTTAIGHASFAADSIDAYLDNRDLKDRPKVDGFRFNLLAALRDHELEPEEAENEPVRGTDSGNFAVHNYEDRSFAEIIPSTKQFLGYFSGTPRLHRDEVEISADNVLGNFDERFTGLSEETAVEEADRCMACGLCMECDNCMIYCPQDAIERVAKDQRVSGRYVETDYTKCVGCYICADVCPSGYIQMGLGA